MSVADSRSLSPIEIGHRSLISNVAGVQRRVWLKHQYMHLYFHRWFSAAAKLTITRCSIVILPSGWVRRDVRMLQLVFEPRLGCFRSKRRAECGKIAREEFCIPPSEELMQSFILFC